MIFRLLPPGFLLLSVCRTDLINFANQRECSHQTDLSLSVCPADWEKQETRRQPSEDQRDKTHPLTNKRVSGILIDSFVPEYPNMILLNYNSWMHPPFNDWLSQS